MNTEINQHPSTNAGEFLRIRHLRLLQLIDEGGSLSHASRELHLSQPAVTKMLHELEDVFGPALVERGARGGRLTARGRVTLDRLALALANFDTALRDVGKVVPTLRVGILPVAAMNLLGLALKRLQEAQIHVRLVLLEATVGHLLDDLLSGKIDCLIGRVEPAWLSQNDHGVLECTPLIAEEMVVACAPLNPLARKRNVSCAELVGQRWVLNHKGSYLRNAFDAAFIESGLTPPVPDVESQSFHTNVRLAGEADMLTFAPLSAIDAYEKLGLVKRVSSDLAFSSGSLSFVNLKTAPQLPAMQALRASLVQHGYTR